MTLSGIAKLAGVNPSTVSRVLNRRRGSTISGPMREKILRICDRANYRPSLAARSTATGKSFRAGLILGAIAQDMGSPIFGATVQGLCETLQKNNYTLTVLWAGSPQGSLTAQIRKYLLSDIADVYVLGVDLINTPVAKIIRAMKKPIVYLGVNDARMPEDISGIRNDPRNAYQALWRMIPESWHGKILFTGFEDSNSHFKADSISEAGTALGIPTDAMSDRFFAGMNANFLFARSMARIFARENLELLKRQKLLWCSSDLFALGICDELRLAGLHPGGDIAVIGYDNIERIAGNSDTPFLTTVDPHVMEIGHAAGKLLLELAENGSMKGKIIGIEAESVIRESFNSPNRGVS